MWISPHATISLRSQRSKLGNKTSLLVKKLLRFVALHPLFKYVQMLRVCLYIFYGYLVSAKCALDGKAIHHFGSSPAFRGAQNDGRPPRNSLKAILPCILLV